MDRQLDIGNGVTIDSSLVTWRFDTSSGPGGQHANRANTRVEATLGLVDLDIEPSVKDRLTTRLGSEVRVSVDTTRSQSRNRDLALDRLEERLVQALVHQKRRKATRPSRSSSRRRVDAKRKRGQTKSRRRKPGHDD
ncbi:MAG: aminoacyl-tRNA hydrolase [Actinomycetia bacterium]|nr:aminoacyl-tRNA hydrolase [Actinomycetes bacterium]MCP4958700.1 aminoacyl-tRNA hydrolase [Actinomycetes bacterium]